MIDWFRSWSKGIVIAVIISTIIEMILPDNTSKKYIKIIIGIFIVYTIISPVINQFTGEDISKYIEVNEFIETSSNVVENNEITQSTTSSIKKIYTQNLENDLKTKLKEKGYVAGNVSISTSNDESYNIEKIHIKIDEKTADVQNQKQTKTIVDNIKSVKVKIENKNLQENGIINEDDKNEIKEYVKNIYEVEINKIDVC